MATVQAAVPHEIGAGPTSKEDPVGDLQALHKKTSPAPLADRSFCHLPKKLSITRRADDWLSPSPRQKHIASILYLVCPHLTSPAPVNSGKIHSLSTFTSPHRLSHSLPLLKSKNVMAEPPPASSSTPPDAPLHDPTRPVNDSMEESGPERVQKRPRLDSGSGVSPSVSIGSPSASASVTAPTSTLPAPVPVPAGSASSSALALEMDTSPDQTRPAKVTINVKSPTSETDASNPRRDLPSVHDTTSTRPDLTEARATPSDIISISSSPTQSPVIQAGDPEDMDENWRPLEEAIQEDEVVQLRGLVPSLVDSFPRVRENLSAQDNLHRIVAIIQKGKDTPVSRSTALPVETRIKVM